MFCFLIFVMNNVSFKANLVVDKKLYTKMPEGTPDGFTDNLVNEYRKFIDHEVMQELTEGDTIELYKAPYAPGFALGLKFSSDKLKKPIDGGVYTNKRIPNVHVGSLYFQTMQFIIAKSGIETRYFERTEDAFIRAAKKLKEDWSLEK